MFTGIVVVVVVVLFVDGTAALAGVSVVSATPVVEALSTTVDDAIEGSATVPGVESVPPRVIGALEHAASATSTTAIADERTSRPRRVGLAAVRHGMNTTVGPTAHVWTAARREHSPRDARGFEQALSGKPPDFTGAVRYQNVRRMSNYLKTRPYRAYLDRLLASLRAG